MEKIMSNKPVHIYGPSFSNFVRTAMLVCEEKKFSTLSATKLMEMTLPSKVINI